MAAAGFYFFNYVPHLEKLVKVSLEAPNFLADKGDSLHVFMTPQAPQAREPFLTVFFIDG